MIALRRKYLKFLALSLLVVLFIFSCISCQSQVVRGNGINVILMIGDGMGWEMARTAAVSNGYPMYASGKGEGLNFQKLEGYTLATTYGTIIQGIDGKFSTGNSALNRSNPITAKSSLLKDFVFNSTFHKESFAPDGTKKSENDGNLVGYDPALGGVNPWTGGSDRKYIKQNYPDSAGTATALYTGVKTYNGAMGVDIYEQRQSTILEQATKLGKSTGLVTSVPISHATPGAAASFVNQRGKYDAPLPDLDNILQQTLTVFQPTVILGGGHPFDLGNATEFGGSYDWRYVTQSTYEELKSKPNDNSYGYKFIERGADAAKKLQETAKSIDPNRGDRLLGLYGARGQFGNLPVSTANGDYSSTGLGSISVFASAVENNQVPQIGKKVRPLIQGETEEKFIEREINENPTLADLTSAALNILGKDKDGFWLMVEGGDIDWAAHDDNIDNLIGAVNSFDKAVGKTIEWIQQNGGWEKNLLIVTADHDHYLTLNENFPELMAKFGAEDLTYKRHKPDAAGHFWGSDSKIKYGWGTHSNRLVPVYYQGASINLKKYEGKDITLVDNPPEGTTRNLSIPGVENAIDQTHIYQGMLEAINAPVSRN
ncbi:MAG: alkaline phosphatase [Cyanobacteria bacterium P01_A01_bin.45]